MNQPNVQFTKGTKKQYGTCNFCNNINAPDNEPMNRLSGQQAMVRICNQCLTIIYLGPQDPSPIWGPQQYPMCGLDT